MVIFTSDTIGSTYSRIGWSMFHVSAFSSQLCFLETRSISLPALS